MHFFTTIFSIYYLSVPVHIQVFKEVHNIQTHTVKTLLASWLIHASQSRHFPPRLKQCGCCACSRGGVRTHVESSHTRSHASQRERLCPAQFIQAAKDCVLFCQSKVTVSHTGQSLAVSFCLLVLGCFLNRR